MLYDGTSDQINIWGIVLTFDHDLRSRSWDSSGQRFNCPTGNCMSCECVWCLSLMLTLRATPRPGWSSLSPGWLCFYLETSDISQISQFHLQNARPPHLASLYTQLLIFLKVCMKIAPSICCSQVQSVCTLAFRSSGVKNFYFLCKITGGINWTFVYKVASPPVNYI